MKGGGFLPGGFANLHGFRVGEFRVERLLGRDRGVPRWEVSCGRCGQPQFIGHLRLAPLIEGRRTQRSLQCTNPSCPLSKNTSGSKTLAEFLKRERLEAEEKANAEGERLAEAQAEWVQERAKEAELDRLKAQFREFWLHQMKTSLPESAIPTLQQWCGFSESARQQILEKCRRDPAVEWRFTNL